MNKSQIERFNPRRNLRRNLRKNVTPLIQLLIYYYSVLSKKLFPYKIGKVLEKERDVLGSRHDKRGME